MTSQIHAEPRHPNRLVFFFPSGMLPARALDEIQSQHPRTRGKPHRLATGWEFLMVDLSPAEQRQAAISSAQSRIATAQALDWPVSDQLRHALNSAILSDSPESLANLVHALDQ